MPKNGDYKPLVLFLMMIVFSACTFMLPNQGKSAGQEISGNILKSLISSTPEQNSAQAMNLDHSADPLPTYRQDSVLLTPTAAITKSQKISSPTPSFSATPNGSPFAPYNESSIPQPEIDSAISVAQKEGKLVLLDFGANWCPDCVVLSRLFNDPSVASYLQDHFVEVKIDVGYWNKNLDVVKKYGTPIEKGIPAVVVLNSNGQIIASTKDGALADARTARPQDILALLTKWNSK